MARKSRARHFSSTLVAAAATLFTLGVALLVLRATLAGSTNATLQLVGQGSATPAPAVLFAGLVLGAIGYALRPRPEPPRPATEPTWLSGDSTDFAGTITPMSELPDESHRGRRPPAQVCCEQVFEDIEWRRFETLCAELFDQAGLETRLLSHGPLGGVDILLYARNSQGPSALIHCRQSHGRPVGVDELREFAGAMAAHRLPLGTFATTSTFTAEALRSAHANGIQALDIAGLLELVSRRPRGEQRALLQQAYQGEYWRPTCASCGLKMVERRPGRSSVWSCADAPRCRFTLPVRRPA
jgi:restriction system protein